MQILLLHGAVIIKTRDEKISSDCRPLELNLNREREASRAVVRAVFIEDVYLAYSLHE
jgi:hypothetical protein